MGEREKKGERERERKVWKRRQTSGKNSSTTTTTERLSRFTVGGDPVHHHGLKIRQTKTMHRRPLDHSESGETLEEEGGIQSGRKYKQERRTLE